MTHKESVITVTEVYSFFTAESLLLLIPVVVFDTPDISRCRDAAVPLYL